MIRSYEYPPVEEHQGRVSHLIREELTQVLGLMQDSETYPESIFYDPYSERTAFAAIDRAVIEMLYRPEIRPGMTQEEAVAALSDLRE